MNCNIWVILYSDSDPESSNYKNTSIVSNMFTELIRGSQVIDDFRNRRLHLSIKLFSAVIFGTATNEAKL